jgi:hypothetical protein
VLPAKFLRELILKEKLMILKAKILPVGIFIGKVINLIVEII